MTELRSITSTQYNPDCLNLIPKQQGENLHKFSDEDNPVPVPRVGQGDTNPPENINTFKQI